MLAFAHATAYHLRIELHKQGVQYMRPGHGSSVWVSLRLAKFGHERAITRPYREGRDRTCGWCLLAEDFVANFRFYAIDAIGQSDAEFNRKLTGLRSELRAVAKNGTWRLQEWIELNFPTLLSTAQPYWRAVFCSHLAVNLY
jgi:hypothetical protein